MKFPKQIRSTAQQQTGVVLLLVLVVLLALTMLGLASTDSGNLQSLMTRNNQFRLEAFNTSHTEINAQLEDYAANIYDDSNSVFKAIDVGTQYGGTLGTNLSLQAKNDLFNQQVELDYKGGCVITGSSLDKKVCYQMELGSGSTYEKTNINSDQVQTFEFWAPNPDS